MNRIHVSQDHKLGIRIFLFLALMLAIPASLQNGYAHDSTLQQPQPMQTTAHQSNQSVPATQTPAPSMEKTAPSLCSTLGFSNNTYASGAGPSDIVVGDLNGDGKADLAVANYDSDSASVFLGNGNGTFGFSTQYPAGQDADSLAIADFFGDRNDDLVVANLYSSAVSYLQGDGDGAFYSPYSFAIEGEPDGVATGDFNNDTYPDIVTANASTNSISIRLNDGIGDLGAVTHVAVSGNPFDVAVDNFNGDNNADLVTTNKNGNSVSVMLGNGNGTFQPPINFPVGNSPVRLAIGDVNSDGNIDIASANRSTNNVSVLLGNGDGLFQTAANFYVGTDPFDVAIGDINGDGKADLVSANHGTNNISVLLGNGNGSFQNAQNFNTGTGTYAVTIGDFNLDGKLDIATANYTAGNVSVLLNTCASLTNTPTSTPMPTNTDTPIPTATDTFTPIPTQTPGGPTATPSPIATACAIEFTDVPAGNTFYQYVRCLACRGIISGYACGGQNEPCNPSNDPYFRPSNPVSRGQLAKIVANSAGFNDTVSGQIFEDVVPGSSFYTFVERLAIHEVMNGYPCGSPGEPCGSGSLPYFRPTSGATRGQLTKIVANAAVFLDPAPSTYTFTDVPVGSTFHIFVERLLLNRPGAMGGYACGGIGEPCDSENRPYFRPASSLSRGQTSKIVGNTFFPNCQTPGK